MKAGYLSTIISLMMLGFTWAYVLWLHIERGALRDQIRELLNRKIEKKGSWFKELIKKTFREK